MFGPFCRWTARGDSSRSLLSSAVPTDAAAVAASPDFIRPVIVVIPHHHRTPELVPLWSFEGVFIWYSKLDLLHCPGCWAYSCCAVPDTTCLSCASSFEVTSLILYLNSLDWTFGLAWCVILLYTYIYLLILLNCDWEIRPRYMGDAAKIPCWALMTDNGNLIGSSKGLDKGIGTDLTVLSTWYIRSRGVLAGSYYASLR